jgi:FkbM family methyltransferase
MTFFTRAARVVARYEPLGTLARRVASKMRRDDLLAEDFMPYGLHAFNRATWVIKETAFGTRVWCSLDERAISRPILLGAYERAESLFIEATVRAGDYVVDAGANIGFHAVHLARLVGERGHVDAFEPLGYLADALDASLAENGFADRVTVRRAALDANAGSLLLRHAPRTANFGGAHFASTNALPPGHADEVVSTVALDTIVGTQRCAFVKIDVEGAEPRVMRGAGATLATSRPIVLSELHDAQLRVVSGCAANDYLAQMAARGYRCSHLTDDGTRGAPIERYDDARPLNVIFDPR